MSEPAPTQGRAAAHDAPQSCSRSRPWVVKLGGSLSRDPLLPRWLAMLAEHGAGRVVIVPGGGPFADEAREAQRFWQFEDLPAHNMAVLAMVQTAYLMQALCPALQPARDAGQAGAVLASGAVAVWMPFELLRSEHGELTHWGATSDTLALWLAERLSARALVLVKACSIDPACSLEELAAAGVVDADIASRSRRAGLRIECVERHDLARVRGALADSEAASQA